VIKRASLDRDIRRKEDAEDKSMMDAAEAYIDTQMKARYHGDTVAIDLSKVSPMPTKRVMAKLVERYSDGTGFEATTSGLRLTMKPVESKVEPKDDWVDILRRRNDPYDLPPPCPPYIWRGGRGPYDRGPMWCSA
jgi:hypothetical protein